MIDQAPDEQALTSDTDGQDIKQQLEEFRKKSEEYLHAWKRAAADFDNYQKRRVKEDQDLVAFTKELVLLRLLPAIEALEQALSHAPRDEQHQRWSAGVQTTLAQFTAALQELGVEKIKTVGELFHHDLHEAVEMVEEVGRSGQIIEEVAAGYTIHGKVIKPAKVKVAK